MRSETTKLGVANQVAIAANRREREYLASIGKIKPELPDAECVIKHVYIATLPVSIYDQNKWDVFEDFVITNSLLIVLVGDYIPTSLSAKTKGSIIKGQRHYSGDRVRTRMEWANHTLSAFNIGWDRLCSEFTNQDGKLLYSGAVAYCRDADDASWVAAMVQSHTFVSSYLWRP